MLVGILRPSRRITPLQLALAPFLGLAAAIVVVSVVLFATLIQTGKAVIAWLSSCARRVARSTTPADSQPEPPSTTHSSAFQPVGLIAIIGARRKRAHHQQCEQP